MALAKILWQYTCSAMNLASRGCKRTGTVQVQHQLDMQERRDSNDHFLPHWPCYDSLENLRSVTLPVHSIVLSFCCPCTCISVVLQVEWCHLHDYTCSKNVKLAYFLSPAASTCLTLKEIENELSEVTGADWYPLGVQLGLRPPTLREIQMNYPLDTERCRREMLDLWLRSAPEASWKSLAQAVQALGRYECLTQKLRRKVPSRLKG